MNVISRRVFILTADSPERGGGVEHFVRELTRGLEGRGYRVEVFHRGNSEPRWISKLGGQIGRKLAGTLRGYWIGRNAQRHISDDVVAVISNSDVGFYPLHSQRPIRKIHVYHGTYRGQSEAIRPFIKYSGYLYLKWWNSMVLERLGARGKIVLSCSDYVRDEVSRFFHCDSTTMWYPLDTVRFQPQNSSVSREALGLPKGRVIGLFAGNSQPTKGFPIVEALVQSLPDVYWVLALLGDIPVGLQGSLNVRILRNVAHAQMPFLYSGADFLLCPSRYDAFPYVVSESIACGTPVIAAPNGASQLFLREPPLRRLLVSGPDAVDEFISAAREVIRDPSFYRRAVIAEVRPKLVELMAPENWWKRFQFVAGI